MSKLIDCYPADGMMWCKTLKGVSIPPFPIDPNYKKKPPMGKPKGGIKKV